MDSFDYFFEKKLLARVDEDVARVAEVVMGGVQAHDHYMRLIGQHEALLRVREMMKDVHRELTAAGR